MTHVNILCFVAFQVNSAIDSDLPMTVKEMHGILENQRLFSFFEKHKEDFDMSIVQPEDREYIESNLSDIALAYGGERFDVENKGFCLLLAYLLELIQRNAGSQDISYDVRTSE